MAIGYGGMPVFTGALSKIVKRPSRMGKHKLRQKARRQHAGMGFSKFRLPGQKDPKEAPKRLETGREGTKSFNVLLEEGMRKTQAVGAKDPSAEAKQPVLDAAPVGKPRPTTENRDRNAQAALRKKQKERRKKQFRKSERQNTFGRRVAERKQADINVAYKNLGLF